MKRLKIVLISLSGFVLLLAVIAACVALLFDPNEYKPQLQAAASKALGMQVKVKGELGVRFLPGLRLTVKDVEIRNQDNELAIVEEIRVGLELMPLLQKEYRIKSVSLLQPKISLTSVTNSSKGSSNKQKSETEAPAIELSKVSVSDGAFNYQDNQTGDKVSANGCDITLHDLRFDEEGEDILQKIFFTSGLNCKTLQVNKYSASNLKLSIAAEGGVFDIKPITLSIFGGDGSGDIRADYSGTTPSYNVRFALPHFSIDELLKTVSSEVILSGPASFSMELALQGKSAPQIERSAVGNVLMHGKNLKLRGYDLDTVFNRFESSQSFNLLDMGALLVAGPAGVAVTKARDFAGILTGAEGETNISTVVAHWRVKQGVMHAKDVAMATKKHRVALLGGIDIAGERFMDVIVALINSKGCAQVQQKINGSFSSPVVEQPSTVEAVAAPVLNVFKKGKELLAGDDCKVIYTGEVAVPAAK